LLPTLTEIKCVQKDGEFVIGITGIDSELSNQETSILASDAIRGPIGWNHSKHGHLLIHKQRIMNIPCWYCEDPANPDHNILEEFPECEQKS
jgi:hypothetical protein